jgi:hypothetical protein
MASSPSIDVGPFRASYHRALVDEAFLACLDAFLQEILSPQVDHPIAKTAGSLTACFDEERYCGPNSAIRNLFRLKLTFHGPTEESTIETDLEFDPNTRSFSARPGNSLYVWTPARQRVLLERKARIQATVKCILDEDPGEVACPLCRAPLAVVNNQHLFDARCPSGCFNYNFHKDDDGNLLHGHFFMGEPN